jgi:hypothetical protein
MRSLGSFNFDGRGLGRRMKIVINLTILNGNIIPERRHESRTSRISRIILDIYGKEETNSISWHDS